MSLSRTARHISLPALLAVVLAATLLAIAPGGTAPAQASAGAATAGARHSAKPVIVLEHGAWADASSWSSVISQLQRSGFTVYAPPNPLRGLPQDSAYLHQFLTQNAALQGQPVVLVGHSYGGAVITNAAATGLVIGTVIGTGVFTMPAVLASGGTVSLAVLAVIAVGALVLATLFGQLTRRIPNSGSSTPAHCGRSQGSRTARHSWS